MVTLLIIIVFAILLIIKIIYFGIYYGKWINILDDARHTMIDLEQWKKLESISYDEMFNSLHPQYYVVFNPFIFSKKQTIKDQKMYEYVLELAGEKNNGHQS